MTKKYTQGRNSSSGVQRGAFGNRCPMNYTAREMLILHREREVYLIAGRGKRRKRR